MTGRLFLASFVMTLLAACVGSRTPTLAVELLAAHCAKPVDTMIVMLPGSFDRATDFVEEGFVDAIRKRDIAADIALVEASVPYYRDGDIVLRLHDDVVAPARARGIRNFWFAGISIGAVGSYIYAGERRDEPGVRIPGLLLIAPYLGDGPIVAEVAASGGIAHWAPPGVIPADDRDRRIWQWMKTLTVDRHDETLPLLYLGFGLDDRFIAGERLLSAAMPHDQVFTAPGGHDWPAWRDVWPRMLDTAPLPRGCQGGR